MSDATMEILTPSYAPDFELCRDLVDSVQRFAPRGTRHRIVVPPGDKALFDSLAKEHVVVETTRQVLPRSIRPLPFVNAWYDRQAPWWPVRGWIAQQIVKLAATAASECDAVLVVDSDIQFVRPFDVDTWRADGEVPVYRLTDAVGPELPRHMIWDDVARSLLDLPRSAATRRHDYICWPCLWEPRTVRRMLDRVSHVAETAWPAAIARQRHFSEMVLYGVFVEAEAAQLGSPLPIVDTMYCLPFSDELRLDEGEISRFLSSLADEDVAVMISAKSGTDLSVRRRAIRGIVP